MLLVVVVVVEQYQQLLEVQVLLMGMEKVHIKVVVLHSKQLLVL